MAHLALALDSTQQISPASCAARPGAVLMSESSEESPADLPRTAIGVLWRRCNYSITPTTQHPSRAPRPSLFRERMWPPCPTGNVVSSMPPSRRVYNPPRRLLRSPH